MNELLLRRRVAASRGDTYDAEVEYLETQGDCYIRTNCVPYGRNVKIQTKFTVIGYTDTSNWINWYSAMGGTGNYQVFRAARYNNNRFVNISNGSMSSGASANPNIAVNLGSTYTISTDGRTITVNGSSTTGRDIGSSPNTGYMTIFSNKFKGRFYYMKIYMGDTLIFDGVPVRVGTVGYIYDNVTGTLFGNAGTGSLILGNDVV